MLSSANVADLNEAWIYTTGGGIYSSPAVANGVVYEGSGDKNLYALDALTGVKEWSYLTGSGIYPSPAVANGVVYVGSYDGKLYCFSLDPGGGVQPWNHSPRSGSADSG